MWVDFEPAANATGGVGNASKGGARHARKARAVSSAVVAASACVFDHKSAKSLVIKGPVRSTTRAPLFAARTLNATGQSRVTLSLQREHLRAACGLRQGERSLTSAQKRSS